MMIAITFNEAEKEVLAYERYYHHHPRVRQKMETLWLKSQELQHKEICRLASISEPTLCRYLEDYQAGGLEKLKAINFYQPESELMEHKQTIKDHFEKYPPATIKQAMAKIEELTGLKRSEPQVGKFLKAIGMKCRKVGMLPAKADPEKQEQFKQEMDMVLKYVAGDIEENCIKLLPYVLSTCKSNGKVIRGFSVMKLIKGFRKYNKAQKKMHKI